MTETLGYIQQQFDGIDLDYTNVIVAYEPVWAIGTGLVPSVEDITTIHKKLKKKFTQALLYGGSVKTTNIQEILSIPNVDGTLIGSGSWKIEDFKQMIKITNKAGK